MTVNGEKVWVPGCRADLISGLECMGIHKVAGVRLDRLSKAKLTQAYCRERARTVRRKQGERTLAAEVRRQVVPVDSSGSQLELFAQS